MYRTKDGYFCQINGLVQTINLSYLKKIIRYFSFDTWESYCYDSNKMSPKTALAIFNKRIESIQAELNPHEKMVSSLNSVNIYFVDDKFICKSLNKNYGTIQFIKPISKGSKDIFICNDTIFVIENGTVINSFSLARFLNKESALYGFTTKVQSKWIDFSHGGQAIISYSIEKNKFYTVKQ